MPTDNQFSTEDCYNVEYPWMDPAQLERGRGVQTIPEKVCWDLFTNDKNSEWGIPMDSFLGRALTYAILQTDGNVCLTLFAQFAALGVAAGRHMDTALFAGGNTLANVYVLLVANAATARKTTALRLATKPVSIASPKHLTGKPASAQGLMKHLAANPVTLLELPEYGEFLSASGEQGGFYKQVKDSIMKWFDGISETVPYSKDTVTITDPRLNIVAACATRLLQEHSIVVDWEGGFYSRFLMVYADREREGSLFLAKQTAHSLSGYEQNQRWLRRLLDQGDDDPLRPYTPEGIEEDAAELWCKWGAILDGRFKSFRDYPAVTAALGRAMLHASKLILLLSLNAEICFDRSWKIRKREVSLAIRIIEAMHLRSVIPIIELVQDNKIQLWKSRIRAIVADGREYGLGAFTEPLGLLARDVQGVVETLVLEGHITTRTVDGALLVRRKRAIAETDEIPDILRSFAQRV